MHLGLDPAANQLREEITEGEPLPGCVSSPVPSLPAASCRVVAVDMESRRLLFHCPPMCAASAALLGAFDEADWERKLPQLADRLAEMGPSHHSRYRVRQGLGPVSCRWHLEPC